MEDFREKKTCGKTTAEMERQLQQTLPVACQCMRSEDVGIRQEHLEWNC
jgi:hypothetical protein